MLAQEIIMKKRDGFELTNAEVGWFISELTQNNLSEGQIAAFAMSVFFNGMTTSERTQLTKEMRDSGSVIDWVLPGPVIDKHSTGGVGDAVSLLLAPALAACGAYVPMVSGRGLGHTGGTLDKFDSIPGYNTKPSISLLKKVVTNVGCAIVGQTDDIAPADKKLYSVRDVTATVESVDLITASILSKKLSMSLNALILDIKCGNGAFMKNSNEARTLAQSIVGVANNLGCNATAMLTDMDEPLCCNVGNALEISYVVDFLVSGFSKCRLSTVVCNMGGEILKSAGLVNSGKDGFEKIRHSFESGASAEIFSAMVCSLGGPKDFLKKASLYLPKAPIKEDIFVQNEGYVQQINTRAIGISLIELGGGRRRSSDIIDHSVGFKNLLSVGDFADRYTPIGQIHAQTIDDLEMSKKMLRESYIVGEKPIKKRNVIIEHIL